jgi:SEC-C motif
MAKFDKKTSDALLKGLHGLRKMHDDMDAKRNEEIWMDIDPGSSLVDILHALKKHDLDKIRKSYDFKGMSALKKGDMAVELSVLVPVHLEKVLHLLDQERYDLLKKVADHNGFLMMDEGMEMSKLENLMCFCLVFGGRKNGRKALVMPSEVHTIFREMDGTDLQSVIKRNTEWIRLTYGMFYYYGVMDSKKKFDTLERLLDREVDVLSYSHVIHNSLSYYHKIRFNTVAGYCDRRVMDPESLLREQQQQGDLGYFPFTKKQLMTAGEEDYLDRTPEMIEFLDFIRSHYDIDTGMLEKIARELIKRSNNEQPMEDTLNFLQTYFEIPSLEFMQELTDRIVDLHNNTRLWVLKGYTPLEVMKEREKADKAARPHHVLNERSPEKVDLKPGSKVGRNDPCPCGSGRKFKKCCGG